MVGMCLVASERVCACSLRSRIVYTQIKGLWQHNLLYIYSRPVIGLILVKEEGRTGFSEGWQGCSEGFPEGEARGKSRGAALPARGKPRPSRLFYSDSKINRRLPSIFSCQNSTVGEFWCSMAIM